MQEVSDIRMLGMAGEEAARRFLEGHGFRILGQNYRCRWGEVDLIARRRDTIYFVEVKTRRSQDAVSPLELISQSKKRRISKVAQYYLSLLGEEASGDFAVVIVDGQTFSCELIEGAFDLAWGY